MKKSKIICLILAVCLFIATFTGCGGDESGKKSYSNVKLSGVNEFPIVEEKIEFDVFMPKGSLVSDLEDNLFTKWYEEKTNVHLNLIVPSGDAQQEFNLMIASGQIPDIILGMGLSREQVLSLRDQGLVQDISAEIEEHGYYIKEMFEEEPTAKEYVTFDGEVYGVPSVSASYTNEFNNGAWVYKPWLDKLGLDIPETTEEFYEMLVAFRDQDPNGNGKKDEIPMIARGVSEEGGLEAYLMSAFIPDDGNNRYYIENGVVKQVAIQPEYREGLIYIKKLYDEGLIYSDSFIIDRQQLTAIGESETPVLGVGTGLYPGYFCNTSMTTPNALNYVAIPPLKGPDGVRATTPRKTVAQGHGFIVTSECDNPAAAVKWADWLVSPEGRRKSQERGLTVSRPAKEGELGPDGQQAVITIEPASEEMIQKYGNGANNVAWYMSGLRYSSKNDSLKTCKLGANTEYTNMMMDFYNAYLPYSFDGFKQITIQAEDADEFADYQILKSEIDAYFAKFIVGDLSITDDWNAYVNDLKTLGIDKYTALLQRNYDAEN